MAPLPLIKLFAVLFKEISKPVAARIKYKAQDHPRFRNITIMIGRRWENVTQYVEIWARGHKIKELKPVNESHALSVGSEFVAQSFLMATTLGLVLAEWYRSSTSAALAAELKREEKAVRAAAREARLGAIEARLGELAASVARLEAQRGMWGMFGRHAPVGHGDGGGHASGHAAGGVEHGHAEQPHAGLAAGGGVRDAPQPPVASAGATRAPPPPPPPPPLSLGPAGSAAPRPLPPPQVTAAAAAEEDAYLAEVSRLQAREAALHESLDEQQRAVERARLAVRAGGGWLRWPAWLGGRSVAEPATETPPAAQADAER